MAAASDIFSRENSRLDVLVEEIFVRVGWHGAVGRQVTALGAQHDFLAFESFRGKLLDSSADTSLAALKPVVDGGVHHVDAAFYRYDGCRSVAFIRLCVRLAEIRADP